MARVNAAAEQAIAGFSANNPERVALAEEVTDEKSKVNILEPEHPVFNWPNKISERDFSGLVEARGSKWMKE